MSTGNFLLLHITAPNKTSNPYRDIEYKEWHAKTIYYSYFDSCGNQIGRSKQIKMNEGQPLPSGLADDIQNPQVIKIAWDAGKTQTYASRLLGYPLHQYIDPENWVDMQVLIKINGYSADSIKQTARLFKIYSKSYKASARFSMLVRILKEACKNDCFNLRQLSGYTINQALNDKGVLINQEYLNIGLRLIQKYDAAICEFERYYDYRVCKENIKKDFIDKLDLYDYDSLLSCDDNTDLSPFVQGLLFIYKFLTSTSIQTIRKLSYTVCSDGRLRGSIIYWNDSLSGRYGGTAAFNRCYTYNSIDPIVFIDALCSIDSVDTCNSVQVIDNSNALIALIFSFRKKKVVLDFSGAVEFYICKMSDCDWRKRAFTKDCLADILRRNCGLTNLSDHQILQIDMHLAMGDGTYRIDNHNKKKWKSLNKEILTVHGCLAAAVNKAISTRSQYNFNDRASLKTPVQRTQKAV